MRVELGVGTEHHDVPFADKSHARWHSRFLAAVNAIANVGMIVYIIRVVVHLRLTVAASVNGVPKCNQCPPPFIFLNPPMLRILEPAREGFREQLLNRPRIYGPPHDCVRVMLGIRLIGLVIRVENELGFESIKFVHCNEIKTPDGGLSPSFQRMMHHEKIKQQHGNGMQIGRSARHRFRPHDFRCHVSRSSEHSFWWRAIHYYIVVIANEHITLNRVKEDVALTDVAIAQARCVQLVVSIDDLVRRGHQRAKRRFRLDGSLQKQLESFESVVPQRHNVAVPRNRGVDEDVLWPEESGCVRTAAIDQVLETPTLLGSGRMGIVPFECDVTVMKTCLEHLALAAATEKLKYCARCARTRRTHCLANRQSLIHSD